MRSEASSDDLIHVLLVGFDGPRAAALTSLFRDAPGLRVEAQAVAGVEPALAALAREPADLIVAGPALEDHELPALREAALGADFVAVAAGGTVGAGHVDDVYADAELTDKRTRAHLLRHAARQRRLFESAEARRRLEGRLQQMQKLESLAELAGGVAHDFNNLLMVIMGNASLALMELEPDAPARVSIEQIEQSARKAAELTTQMLAYAGGGAIRTNALDLSKLVGDMRQLLGATVPPDVRLVYELAERVPPVRADAGHLRQLVLNLVTNAVEALESRPGSVVLRTGEVEADRRYLAGSYIDEHLPEGGYVFLDVQDDGSGMNEVTRRRLFDPFYTTKFTGRGLGLAAVLGIVRAHRGAIRVESAPGRGSAFRILFPAAAVTAAAGPEPAVPPAPVRPHGAVLVVDDDELVRFVTRTLLERAGYLVEVASDGDEGVARFTERPADFDVVLLDLTMPRMDGHAAFERIRAIRPDARIILSSGYTEDQAVARFSEGLSGFLHKPYEAQDLLAAIQRALGGRPGASSGAPGEAEVG